MKVAFTGVRLQRTLCHQGRSPVPTGLDGKQQLRSLRRSVLVSQSTSNGSSNAASNGKTDRAPSSVLEKPTETPPASPVATSHHHQSGHTGASLNGSPDSHMLADILPSDLNNNVHGSMDPCLSGASLTCASTTEEAAPAQPESADDKVAATVALLATKAALGDPPAPDAPASAPKATKKTKGGKTIKGSPYLAAGGRWSSVKGYSAWRRTLQIYTFAIKFAFRYWRITKEGTYKKVAGGMSPANLSAKRTEVAIWLREELIKLGPTFIKIGQQFSTRVDVLSPEFIRELEQLQDNVPPFDADTVSETINRNFGKPAEELFEDFNYTPIAAASLGQVHLAKLNGQSVVVKVQRPGLKDLFDIDLKNVRVLAEWLQRLDPKTDGAARDWVAIYDECSRILYEEIDYRQEAKYAIEFAENFATTEWVKVPTIYTEYCNAEVLVMEYCPGVKINQGDKLDEMGLDRDRLARLAVESYLQQLLRHGLFHADPHPGNVAVDAVGGGRLIYYDFGMMGRIVPNVRLGLLDLFYGVYKKDTDKCLDALVTMGVLVEGGDRTAIKRTAEFFLKSFQDRLEEQRIERANNPQGLDDFKAPRSKDASKAKRKEILATIGEDLLIASADQPFRFPATFTFVVRSFTVLDGIGKSLSPRFDISEISAPYARELLLEGRPVFDKFKADFSKKWFRQEKAVKGLFTGPIKIDEMSDFLGRIESGDFKPRVRALETERALQRVQAWLGVMATLVASSTLVNVGTVLSVSALPMMSTVSFVFAALLGVLTVVNILKVKKLEKKEMQLLGQA